MLYVKPQLSTEQTVAEILAAQIAIGLGLPCPQPYLVSISPHCVGRPRGPALTAFGSEQVGPRGLAVPVRSRDILLEMLSALKIAEAVAVLDEFIANDVRGPGDIVFDPANSVWLIDHEAALRSNVTPQAAVTNWLGDRLRERTDFHHRDALLSAFRAQAVKVRKLQIGPVPGFLEKLHGGKDSYLRALEFLHNRLSSLDFLLSQRALPEQQYLHEPNAANQNDSLRAADL